MDWVIEPYVGVGDLKFGMDAANVEALLGPPHDSDSRGMWTRYEFRKVGGPVIGYNNQGLGEINFGRRFGPGLTFNGHDVFSGDSERFLALVSAADPGLVESFGTIVSRRLGLSFGGFRADEDPNDRSISVFRQGVWTDKLLMRSVPVHFPESA